MRVLKNPVKLTLKVLVAIVKTFELEERLRLPMSNT